MHERTSEAPAATESWAQAVHAPAIKVPSIEAPVVTVEARVVMVEATEFKAQVVHDPIVVSQEQRHHMEANKQRALRL